MGDCLICNRIEEIKKNKNKYFVRELETGYVVIGDHQYFKGYTLFLCKEHTTELHFLDPNFKCKYMEEMSMVGEAVYNAFKPNKLNYELLGNGDAHLHWHIFPRFDGDMDTRGPVWWLDKNIMYSDNNRPSDSELEQMKMQLAKEIDKIAG